MNTKYIKHEIMQILFIKSNPPNKICTNIEFYIGTYSFST